MKQWECLVSKEVEDRVYYARRALKERQRATASADFEVACKHLLIAEEYERRARGLPARLHYA